MDFLTRRPGRAVALYLALLGYPASGQAVTEYQIKAAFLFNFAKFVEWPLPASFSPFCIAVGGDDPFAGALEEATKNRTIDGRKIVIRHFKLGSAQPGCEIVFLAVTPKGIRAALAPFQGTSSLTVGDVPGFCRSGGMIGLQLVDSKVRLEINPEAAQKAHLQVSSKLLALASLVHDTGP